MQYRRITEVVENDKKRPSIHSKGAESWNTNAERKHSISGPKTPAEADCMDEDVTQFKRIQIVAPPSSIAPANTAGTGVREEIEPQQAIGRTYGRQQAFSRIDTHRPILPAPTESIISGSSSKRRFIETSSDINSISRQTMLDLSYLGQWTSPDIDARKLIFPAPTESIISGALSGNCFIEMISDMDSISRHRMLE